MVSYIILFSRDARIESYESIVEDSKSKFQTLGEGRMFVRGWRIKFIFLLIVYFAGFATAIYTLAPVPESKAGPAAVRASGQGSHVTSEEFVESFNTGMRKCIDFGKDAALRVARYIKQKADEPLRQWRDKAES